jgi:hypothetical protein
MNLPLSHWLLIVGCALLIGSVITDGLSLADCAIMCVLTSIFILSKENEQYWDAEFEEPDENSEEEEK